MQSVGTYEAKTRLSQLIAKVNHTGEQIAITNHGVTVALLVPPQLTMQRQPALPDAIERWRRARKGTSLNGLKVRDLINEGRR
jgi:prevent-host-death family protein